MVEPRYFEAVRAESLCKARKFVMGGMVLQPFSMRHALQLEALGNPLWCGGRIPEGLDYIEAAFVCSHREMITDFPDVTMELLASLDGSVVDTWNEYVATCYESRPRLRQSDEIDPDSGSPFKAPTPEFLVTFILRKSNGYTREWLETAALGLVYWIYEAICEQEIGKSSIYPEAEYLFDLAASTKEAKAESARRSKLAGQINAEVKDQKRRMRLLRLLSEGKLPKDWRKGAKRGRK